MAEIIKIDDSTWRIEDGFVRFFLLVGSNKAALIDSGVSHIDIRKLASEFTDLPLILINTHGDMDHSAGTGEFSEIYMTKEDYLGCRMDEKFPRTKLIAINDRDIIDLGNRTLEIITIPGHTKGSVAILDVEKRYLFAGDSVQKGHIYMFGAHRDPDSFENSLNVLINESERYDKVIASHDEPMLDGDYAIKVLESWKEVRSGAISPQNIELHGLIVKSYDAKYCGFYME